MLYSSIDFENLMAYKTSQYRQEADRYRLARLAGWPQRRPRVSSYRLFLDELGTLLVAAGRKLQEQAACCLPLDEYAGQLR